MSSLSGATLVPAYGRDYSNAKLALSDFEAGKDFALASIFHGWGYVSRADFQGGDRVLIRYGKLRKIVSATVKGGAS